MSVSIGGNRLTNLPHNVWRWAFGSHHAARYLYSALLLPGIAKTQIRPGMEVQIFGVKKSADTRKAQRFFSERRVRAHFVDLVERPIAAGELERFIQKFGLDKIIDRESKRFEELGLKYAQPSASRWIDKLIEEPLLLRLPLVRRLGQSPALTIGHAEETWESWIG